MRQRLRKLSPEKDVERYLDNKNRSQIENARRVLDMEGWRAGGGSHMGEDAVLRADVRGPAGPGVAKDQPVYVRTPSDPGDWGSQHSKPMLDTKDGERFYRRRAEEIRDGMRAEMRASRRLFSLRLDLLGHC